MGQNFTRIENVFFTECQSHLTLLDDMLISQASSVDSIHTTATLLLRQLEGIGGIKEGGVTDSNVDIEHNLKLTKDLLRSVDGTLINQTMAVLQALGHLKRSIKCKAKEQTLVTMPALKNQKIEEYINQHQEKEDGAHQDQVGSDDTALTIEKLKKEIDNLKSEKEVQMKKMKKMNDEYQKLMKKTADMEKELTNNDKKPVQLDVVPVQLFYQQGGDQMASVVQDIMSLMNKQDKFGDRRLAFITYEDDAKIQANIPLLVFCFNKSRLGTDATHAIQGIQQNSEEGLKEEIISTYKELDVLQLQKQETDRMMVKKFNEEALKKKNDAIEILQKKLERQMRTGVIKVDKETMTHQNRQNHDNVNRAETKTLQRDLSEEDQEIGTENETFADDLGLSLKEDREMRLKEEIHSLKKEIDVLKYHTVQTVLEYEAFRSARSERERYDDLYKALQVEMTQCKIDLQIHEYVPSKFVQVPHDKAIVILLSYPSYMYGIKRKIKQAVAELTAAPNIAVILFHNTSDGRLQTYIEKPVEREMNNLGGFFRFGFSYSKQPDRSERNQENFSALLQFLKSVGSESKHISR